MIFVSLSHTYVLLLFCIIKSAFSLPNFRFSAAFRKILLLNNQLINDNKSLLLSLQQDSLSVYAQSALYNLNIDARIKNDLTNILEETTSTSLVENHQKINSLIPSITADKNILIPLLEQANTHRYALLENIPLSDEEITSHEKGYLPSIRQDAFMIYAKSAMFNPLIAVKINESLINILKEITPTFLVEDRQKINALIPSILDYKDNIALLFKPLLVNNANDMPYFKRLEYFEMAIDALRNSIIYEYSKHERLAPYIISSPLPYARDYDPNARDVSKYFTADIFEHVIKILNGNRIELSNTNAVFHLDASGVDFLQRLDILQSCASKGISLGFSSGPVEISTLKNRFKEKLANYCDNHGARTHDNGLDCISHPFSLLAEQKYKDFIKRVLALFNPADSSQLANEARKTIDKIWAHPTSLQTLKFLLLFLGDKFIEGVFLPVSDHNQILNIKAEGGNQLFTLSGIRNLINDYMADPTLPHHNASALSSITRLLDTGIFLENNSAIESLPILLYSLVRHPDCNFWLPSGWLGDIEAHAVIVWFRSSGDGHPNCVDISTINSGEGLSKYHATVTVNDEPRYSAMLTYRHVPVDEIPDEFWKVLTLIHKGKLSDSDGTAEDFYQVVFSLIPEKYKQTVYNGDETLFILSQLAGTCSIKSIVMAMKQQMPLNTFRTIITILRVKAFIKFFDKINAELQSERMAKMLTAIAKTFFRKLKKISRIEKSPAIISLNTSLIAVLSYQKNNTDLPTGDKSIPVHVYTKVMTRESIRQFLYVPKETPIKTSKRDKSYEFIVDDNMETEIKSLATSLFSQSWFVEESANALIMARLPFWITQVAITEKATAVCNSEIISYLQSLFNLFQEHCTLDVAILARRCIYYLMIQCYAVIEENFVEILNRLPKLKVDQTYSMNFFQLGFAVTKWLQDFEEEMKFTAKYSSSFPEKHFAYIKKLRSIAEKNDNYIPPPEINDLSPIFQKPLRCLLDPWTAKDDPNVTFPPESFYLLKDVGFAVESDTLSRIPEIYSMKDSLSATVSTAPLPFYLRMSSKLARSDHIFHTWINQSIFEPTLDGMLAELTSVNYSAITMPNMCLSNIFASYSHRYHIWAVEEFADDICISLLTLMTSFAYELKTNANLFFSFKKFFQTSLSHILSLYDYLGEKEYAKAAQRIMSLQTLLSQNSNIPELQMLLEESFTAYEKSFPVKKAIDNRIFPVEAYRLSLLDHNQCDEQTVNSLLQFSVYRASHLSSSIYYLLLSKISLIYYRCLPKVIESLSSIHSVNEEIFAKIALDMCDNKLPLKWNGQYPFIVGSTAVEDRPVITIDYLESKISCLDSLKNSEICPFLSESKSFKSLYPLGCFAPQISKNSCILTFDKFMIQFLKDKGDQYRIRKTVFETGISYLYVDPEQLSTNVFGLQADKLDVTFTSRNLSAWSSTNEISVYLKSIELGGNLVEQFLFSIQPDGQIITANGSKMSIPSHTAHYTMSSIFRPDGLIPFEGFNGYYKFFSPYYILGEDALRICQSTDKIIINDEPAALRKMKGISHLNVPIILSRKTALLPAVSPAYLMSIFNQIKYKTRKIGIDPSPIYTELSFNNILPLKDFPRKIKIYEIPVHLESSHLKPKSRFDRILSAYYYLASENHDMCLQLLNTLSLFHPFSHLELQALSWIFFVNVFIGDNSAYNRLVKLSVMRIIQISMRDCQYLPIVKSNEIAAIELDNAVNITTALEKSDIWQNLWSYSKESALWPYISQLQSNWPRYMRSLPPKYRSVARELTASLGFAQKLKSREMDFSSSHVGHTVRNLFPQMVTQDAIKTCFLPFKFPEAGLYSPTINTCVIQDPKVYYSSITEVSMITCIIDKIIRASTLKYSDNEWLHIKAQLMASIKFKNHLNLNVCRFCAVAMIDEYLKGQNNLKVAVETFKQTGNTNELQSIFSETRKTYDIKYFSRAIFTHLPKSSFTHHHEPMPVEFLELWKVIEERIFLNEMHLSSLYDATSIISLMVIDSKDIPECHHSDQNIWENSEQCVVAAKNISRERIKMITNAKQYFISVKQKILSGLGSIKPMDLNILVSKFNSLISKCLSAHAIRKIDTLKIEAPIEGYWRKFASDLLISSSRNLWEFQQHFPGITLEICQKMYDLLLQMFLQISAYQRLKRIEMHLKKLDEQSDSSLVSRLIEEFTVRPEDAYVRPELIVFEVYADFRLRNSHLDDLNFLTNAILRNEHQTPQWKKKYSKLNRVLQRAMAGGKTMVLGTFTIFYIISQGKVPVMILPQSLIDTSGPDLLTRTLDRFGLNGHILHFTRSFVSNEKRLKDILEILFEAKKKGEYIITTPEDLLSIRNAYFENNENKNDSATDLLSQILTFFRENCIAIFDEIDLTFIPFSELNFPIGLPEQIDVEFVYLIRDFFLVADAIRSKYYDIKNPPLSIDRATYFLYVQEILNDPRMLKYQPIISEAKSDSESIPARLLHQFKEEMFFSTLNQSYLEDYGLHSNESENGKHFAVPFLAANIASLRSEFLNPILALIKTFISYIKSGGFSKARQKLVLRLLRRLLKSAMVSSQLIDKSSLWLNMHSVLFENHEACPSNPKSLFGISDVDFEKCYASFSATEKGRQFIFSAIVDIAVSQIEVYKNQISACAQDFLFMFFSYCGYTGTLYNELILESGKGDLIIKSDPLIAASIVSDIYIKNIQIVSVPDRSNILDIYEGHKATLPGEPLDKIRAIIDLGAMLKYFSDNQSCEQICKAFPSLKTILHFLPGQDGLLYRMANTSHSQLLTNSDEDTIEVATKAQPSERFTTYDQLHITGVDIVQMTDAIAWLTIGVDTIFRDLLQALMRMRKFQENQRIIFVINESTYNEIHSKLGLAQEAKLTARDIIRHTFNNQTQRIVDELQTSCVQKLEAAAKNEIVKNKTTHSSLSHFAIKTEDYTIVPNNQTFVEKLNQHKVQIIDAGYEQAILHLETYFSALGNVIAVNVKRVDMTRVQIKEQQIESQIEQSKEQEFDITKETQRIRENLSQLANAFSYYNFKNSTYKDNNDPIPHWIHFLPDGLLNNIAIEELMHLLNIGVCKVYFGVLFQILILRMPYYLIHESGQLHVISVNPNDAGKILKQLSSNIKNANYNLLISRTGDVLFPPTIEEESNIFISERFPSSIKISSEKFEDVIKSVIQLEMYTKVRPFNRYYPFSSNEKSILLAKYCLKNEHCRKLYPKFTEQKKEIEDVFSDAKMFFIKASKDYYNALQEDSNLENKDSAVKQFLLAG